MIALGRAKRKKKHFFFWGMELRSTKRGGLPTLQTTKAKKAMQLADDECQTGAGLVVDPRDVFAAKYLEKHVGLSSEEAAKIVTDHGWWCLYEAQRRRGGLTDLEDLMPGCSDEVYEKLQVHLAELRAARASARRNAEIRALVAACSEVRGCDSFRINGHAWPLIEEKLLDAGVTIERVVACKNGGGVMGVFGPDQLEELSCVLGPSVNVAGMLEHVGGEAHGAADLVESAEPVESVESVESVEPKERSEEGSDGPEEVPVPGTPPPAAVPVPGKPKDREDREDRGRCGAKKRRLFLEPLS
jgi:hypothetical protein